MYILYFLFFTLSFGGSAEISTPADPCKVRPVTVNFANEDGANIQICDHHLGDPVQYGVVNVSDIHSPIINGQITATSTTMNISFKQNLPAGSYYFGASIDGKMDHYKFVVQ